MGIFPKNQRGDLKMKKAMLALLVTVMAIGSSASVFAGDYINDVHYGQGGYVKVANGKMTYKFFASKRDKNTKGGHHRFSTGTGSPPMIAQGGETVVLSLAVPGEDPVVKEITLPGDGTVPFEFQFDNPSTDGAPWYVQIRAHLKGDKGATICWPFEMKMQWTTKASYSGEQIFVISHVVMGDEIWLATAADGVDTEIYQRTTERYPNKMVTPNNLMSGNMPE